MSRDKSPESGPVGDPKRNEAARRWPGPDRDDSAPPKGGKLPAGVEGFKPGKR